MTDSESTDNPGSDEYQERIDRVLELLRSGAEIVPDRRNR